MQTATEHRTGHFYNARAIEAHLLDLHRHDTASQRLGTDELLDVHLGAHVHEWGVPHVHDEDGTPRPVGSQTSWGKTRTTCTGREPDRVERDWCGADHAAGDPCP